MMFYDFFLPANALLNEKVISEEEQVAIDRFYVDLENAYNAISHGNEGYMFCDLDTGKIVTNEVINLFENEFQNRQHDIISTYCNDNQIAIIKGNLTNSITPFACIGDGCAGGSSVIIRQTSNTFTKNFTNRYYLEVLGQTVQHIATVSFSARYVISADTPHTFVNWDQNSDYLSWSLNSSSSLDGIRFGYTSIDLNNTTQKGVASFSIYSRTTMTDSSASGVYEYFICNGEITLFPNLN